jgi:hypothetical protein
MAEWLQNEWQGMLAGGGLYAIVREVGGFALRLYAAKLRADDDKSNDAVADVVDEAGRRLSEKK